MKSPSIPRFDWRALAAADFFDEHGFVVVHGVLDDADRERIRIGWDEVVSDASSRVGMPASSFVERFPQNRDLWRKSAQYRHLLFETAQSEAARRLLKVRGVRLFHDHAICKPLRASGPIPWHQDSAYWPLDRVGASLWTPVADVPIDGGCLKVLDRSHRDGPGEPQDFLRSDAKSRDRDPRLTQIPVRLGETVVLNGLTWHGSDANRGSVDRLAYLTLWVPATSRFVPDHAGWHPTAGHIHVSPGARLDGEWFPLFGDMSADDEGQHVQFPPPDQTGGPRMFTASQDIAAQIAWLLGAALQSVGALLGNGGAERVVAIAVTSGLVPLGDQDALRQQLDDLVLQDRVRRESVARDVYLGTVSRWWSLIGAAIDERMRQHEVE